MATVFNNGAGSRSSVTARAISGHATGITLPTQQNAGARARIGDPSNSQARVLASSQPNTDRRRFVTHR